jgi:redox-sensitive bicupin YhaK (pirin superfamily)
MDRKEFIKKGLMGTGVFIVSGTMSSVAKNDIEELKELEVLGFNHLPGTNSIIMDNTVLHKASSRGYASHSWLETYHTFSFASYYNPERMHFGALRVLNDDVIDGGKGFGRHPHDNMEIITIPLEGALEHKDSMKNTAVIEQGDVQVMSAGTGIFHSEYNKNKDQKVRLLQIWVFPNKKNVEPRYDQMSLKLTDRHNRLQQIVSPNPDDAGVWIYQDAWFHLGKFDKGIETQYSIKKSGNGVYAFIISGDIRINDQILSARDGLGIWNTENIMIQAESDAEFLLMDVPMVL